MRSAITRLPIPRFMFRKKVEGLIFKFPRKVQADLHMLFVFFPLDIIFLDENMKVIKVLKRVKPFLPFVRGAKANKL